MAKWRKTFIFLIVWPNLFSHLAAFNYNRHWSTDLRVDAFLYFSETRACSCPRRPSLGSKHRPLESGWRAVGLCPPCMWWLGRLCRRQCAAGCCDRAVLVWGDVSRGYTKDNQQWIPVGLGRWAGVAREQEAAWAGPSFTKIKETRRRRGRTDICRWNWRRLNGYINMANTKKKRLFAILQSYVRPLLASTISLLEKQTRDCSSPPPTTHLLPPAQVAAAAEAYIYIYIYIYMYIYIYIHVYIYI